MNTRFDICTPRKSKDGKTFWTKIGTAWQSDKGTQLVFDALPLPDSEGRCVANLFEPKPRDGGQRVPDGGRGSPPPRDDLDDDIPFARNDTVW
jgi:hypothetical protein